MLCPASRAFSQRLDGRRGRRGSLSWTRRLGAPARRAGSADTSAIPGEITPAEPLWIISYNIVGDSLTRT